jgi:hypothetical protein
VRRVPILLLFLAAAAVTAAAALAARSPKQLRTSIDSAIFSEGSVHYVETGTAKGLRQTTVGDAATDHGIQQITVHLGRKTGHFTVLVIVQTLYLRGDRTALNAYLGFPAAAARKYAGRWISIPHTSSAYGTLAADVTLASLVADHVASRKTTVVQGKVAGKSVIGLRGVTTIGGVSNTSTLYVRSAKHALPLEGTDVSTSHSFTDKLEFDRWNESVQLKAPAKAIPIAKIGG